MSRIETDREDLIRDATALRIRAEFRLPDQNETVIAGRRESGGWSIYFGQDPCYHFDADGGLRGAFVRDRLYRTQGVTLAELQRVRMDEATTLLRRDLEPPERDAFLNVLQERLARLRLALRTGAAVALRAVPADADVAALLTQFLTDRLDSPPALAPPIKTRRR